MAKEKIVRCFVSGNGGGDAARSVRYVPLHEYDLWRHLMADRHGFKIEEDCVSLWFDIDGDPNITYAASNYEQVVRISLWIYSDDAGMFRRVTRYFPSESYEQIKPRFLAHYEKYFNGSRFPARIVEARGVWLKREEQPA
jgi:hypothetical protein